MPGPAVATHFHLDIAPLFKGLQVLSFSGREAISELFTFELEVVIDAPDLDAPSLMYRAAFLSFKGAKEGVHGQIHSIMRSHFRPGPACYQMTLGPRMACLGQRYTPRIFQQLTVPQIISRVLSEHGIREGSHLFDLRDEYPKREFCAQYRETDLQLVQRLCAEEGIHYHFQHSRNAHVLVLGDGLRVFRRAPTATVQHVSMQPGVSRFKVVEDDGEPEDGRRQQGRGESTLPFISSGHLLPLTGHPDESLNHLWLVSEVVHRGRDARLPRRVTSHETGMYSNHFQVAPWEAGFKPQPRPRVYTATIQCAYVVGGSDEPVSRDAQGRVRVQLDWGYQGEGAAYAECWLPVDPQLSETLCGGMQVVVSFIEGDMDRPMISACLWPVTEAAPQPWEAPRPPEKIEMHLELTTLEGDESFIQVEGGSRISYAQGCELSFSVGDSTLSIDDTGVKLSSPHILLAAAQVTPEDDPQR